MAKWGRLVVLVVLFVVTPTLAWAYVDPGILGVLYQLVYVFFFGTLVAWLLRPWRYLKVLFERTFRRPVSSNKIEEEEVK